MWKIVVNDKIVETITNPINVRIGDTRISNILKLSDSHRKFLGIYKFIPAPKPDRYHNLASAPSYTIDHDLGEVREVVSFIPKDLDTVKLLKKEDLKQYRNRVLSSGVKWGAYVVQTDEISLARVQGMMLTFLVNTDPNLVIPWRMADNNVVLLTRTDAQDLSTTVSSFVSNCYAEQARQEAMIDTYTDPLKVINHPIEAGNWPVNRVL